MNVQRKRNKKKKELVLIIVTFIFFLKTKITKYSIHVILCIICTWEIVFLALKKSIFIQMCKVVFFVTVVVDAAATDDDDDDNE